MQNTKTLNSREVGKMGGIHDGRNNFGQQVELLKKPVEQITLEDQKIADFPKSRWRQIAKHQTQKALYFEQQAKQQQVQQQQPTSTSTTDNMDIDGINKAMTTLFNLLTNGNINKIPLSHFDETGLDYIASDEIINPTRPFFYKLMKAMKTKMERGDLYYRLEYLGTLIDDRINMLVNFERRSEAKREAKPKPKPKPNNTNK